MNKMIIVALLSVFSMAETASVTKQKSVAVCQSYIDQTKEFKKTMGTDKVSQETFAFYKQKMLVHCGSIVSKVKFEKQYFSEMMMKAEVNTVPECRMAIAMASKYSENKKQSSIIVAAHRENIADNCGSLVASHVSAYCLYGDEK
jgi:hypothetical protein